MTDEQAVESKFSIEVSGVATEEDALSAFEDLVGLNDSVYGSVVINGVSHDASEFREEEEAPAPTQLPAPRSEPKAETKGDK